MSRELQGGIVVTGASSGLGSALALELARRGMTVACLSRRGSVPISDAPLQPEIGERLIPYTCDVTDADRTEEVLADFAQTANGIRGLVNNAGRQMQMPSAEMAPDQLRSLLETNFIGAFSMARLAYGYLREDGGLIVNIGSFYDNLGARGNLAYAASKAAIASMTRSLAVEWAQDRIAVLTIAPGYILTELNQDFFSDEHNLAAVTRRIPLRRIGRAEEVARLVAALFQERIAYLTGTTIYCDGGQGINL